MSQFLYGSTSSIPFEFYASSDEVIYQFSTTEDFDAWLRSSVDSFPAEWNCDMLQQDGYYYLPQWPASMEARLEAAGFSTYGQIKLFYKTPKEGTVMVRYMLSSSHMDSGYHISADHYSANASFSLDDGYCISTGWELPDRYQLAMSSMSGISLSEPVSDTCPEAADHITELLAQTTWARIRLK